VWGSPWGLYFQKKKEIEGFPQLRQRFQNKQKAIAGKRGEKWEKKRFSER